MSAQSEIRQKLRAVNREDPFNAFDLDDETLFDDEIHAVRGVKLNAFVHDWQPDFLFEMKTRCSELIGQAGAAGAFEHAGSESRVDAHGTANDDPAGSVWFHESPGFLCVLGVHCVESVQKQRMNRA